MTLKIDPIGFEVRDLQLNIRQDETGHYVWRIKLQSGTISYEDSRKIAGGPEYDSDIYFRLAGLLNDTLGIDIKFD